MRPILSNPYVRIFARSTPKVKSATLVIPVYCESNSIPHLIEQLKAVKWPVPTEWIFVDDASTDDSVQVIERFQKTCRNIRLIKLPLNRGKGNAIREGFRLAKGEIVAVQDADNEYDPNDLPGLMKPILDKRADVVYGTRYGKGSGQVHRTYHRLGNLFLTLLSNFCSNLHLSDMEVCYKVFRTDVVRAFKLETSRFGFEPEVTAYLAKFDLRILEFPVQYFPRSYLQGKKIGWRDGIAAIWFILRFNFFRSGAQCLTSEAIATYEISSERKAA